MAKTIIPIKLILTQDGAGNMQSAILQYQVNDNGSISPPFNSVQVLPAVTAEACLSLFSAAILSANQSEGL